MGLEFILFTIYYLDIMDPTLNVTIDKETLVNGLKVTFTVTDSESMPDTIFVKRKDTGEYNRVASRFDINTYPDSATNGIIWYRDRSFDKTFEFEEEVFANVFVDEISAMINRLVLDYQNDPFEGSEEVEYPEED